MIEKRKGIKTGIYLLAGVALLFAAAFFVRANSKKFVTIAAEDEDITISTDTTWAAGEYTYRDIIINNNATLTLAGDTDLNIGVTINARNITVEPGSYLSADAQGYGNASGPGAGSEYSGYGGGGAYGGNGGDARYLSGDLGKGGTSYGSTLNPSSLGSGGAGGAGGAGGGIVDLNLSGDLTVDGSITANGGNGGSRDGGGSGGAIHISTVGMSGVGTVSANGGNGNGIDGGGGGGGRVAVYYSGNNSFNVSNITVSVGTGSTRYDPPTEGTVFTFDANSKNLTVSKDVSFSVDEGINENGQLSSDGVYNFNDLTINNNATLTLQSDTDNGTGVTINASNITVDSGSYLSATGQGYGAASGPGGGYCDDTNCSNGTGGSYGGKGGTARYWTTVRDTYGEVMDPTDLGSGGGTAGGSNGGGLIKLVVDEEVSVDGGIIADGADTINNRGAGSGGSIKINTTTLSGSGVVTANGGNAPGDGGGGGGGRIAIYYSNISLPTANINTTGGDGFGDTCDGDDGSIFYYNVSTGNVDIANDLTLYANQGINRDGTLRSDGVYYYNNLTITNNSTVTVASYWTDESDGRGVTINLDGDLTVEPGSSIDASGQGYTTEIGSGKGRWDGGLASGSGGAYGGSGGLGWHTTAGGDPYGENERYYPYFLGSPGGDAYGNPGGGSGGGAVAIRVLGNVEVDGTIKSDGSQGGDGLSDYAGGGGSGGSVFLVGSNFTGTGSISADGGACGPGTNSKGGGGGGGRVSIAYFNNFTIDQSNVTATGGTGEGDVSRNGEDGTVYIRKMELPVADFDLKNPNNSSISYTNSQDVSIEPDDPDASEYYESSNGDPTPAFYVQGWANVNEGKHLTDGEGSKTVRAWIKDNNQLISSAPGQATIVLDQTNPSLSVSQSGNNKTSKASIDISGIASDALSGIESVSVNSTQASLLDKLVNRAYAAPESQDVVVMDGNFSTTVDLELGENNIEVIAYDKAGNSTLTSLTITRLEDDGTQPTSTATVTTTQSSEPQDDTQTQTSTAEDSTGSSSNESETSEDQGQDDGPISTDKIENNLGDDFEQDGDELIYKTKDPIIYGKSQSNANIDIYLDASKYETRADSEGSWEYQFYNLKPGDHSLIIEEYDSDDNWIKTSNYKLTINAESDVGDYLPVDDGFARESWLLWVIIVIVLIIASYSYYRHRKNSK